MILKQKHPIKNMPHKLKAFSIPLLFLFIIFLAYGLLLNRLGFYWDDWVYVYRYINYGIFEPGFYRYSRDFVTYLLFPGFLFAGASVLRWHIYSILLRWALALAGFWVLRLLWPRAKLQNMLIALLFAVYPSFTQQSMAVTYSIHQTAYIIFFLSLAFMLLAQKQSRRFWLWTIFALGTQAFHLFSWEYFVGLELIRPVMLWLAVAGGLSLRDKGNWKKVFRTYWPYFLLYMLYLLWRLGGFGGGFATYGLETVFAQIAQDPR